MRLPEEDSCEVVEHDHGKVGGLKGVVEGKDEGRRANMWKCYINTQCDEGSVRVQPATRSG